ncbi:FAD-binding oxidoreductase [Kineococcus sp. SYSU DK003]|uniref:FAD-binding oxidoreductase n=1 Tax=Kineococcus sp. SYSU DK003 TaxID=3383124 RepID=UPI003D7E174D
MSTTGTAVDRLAADPLHDLSHLVLGPVWRPGDAEYAAGCPGFNVATVHRPEAIVAAADPGDVVATVRWAVRHGRTLAVRATGHGAPATGPGTVLLDTRGLDAVSVDAPARTATVGAGARWQAVLDAAAPAGLGALCGSAPGVGVVGYTLGGGLGPVARTFGLAVDRVRSIDLVSADGRLRRIDAICDPDLFWAVRGGGAAFGIVTSMTFDLLPVASVTAGGAWFSAQVARTVLQRWREWAAAVPGSVSTSLSRLNLPPDPALPEALRGQALVHVRFTHVGEQDSGVALFAPMLQAATPLLSWVQQIPFAQIGRVHADPVDPLPVAERGLLLTEFPAAAVDAFVEVTSAAAGLPLLAAELRLLGGAVAEVAGAPASAAGGRSAAFSLHVLAVAVPPIAEAVPAALQTVLDRMAPWSTGGCLVNFSGVPSPAVDAAVAAGYSAADYQRLLDLRQRHDPGGVFAAAARWAPMQAGERSCG